MIPDVGPDSEVNFLPTSARTCPSPYPALPVTSPALQVSTLFETGPELPAGHDWATAARCMKRGTNYTSEIKKSIVVLSINPRGPFPKIGAIFMQ